MPSSRIGRRRSATSLRNACPPGSRGSRRRRRRRSGGRPSMSGLIGGDVLRSATIDGHDPVERRAGRRRRRPTGGSTGGRRRLGGSAVAGLGVAGAASARGRCARRAAGRVAGRGRSSGGGRLGSGADGGVGGGPWSLRRARPRGGTRPRRRAGGHRAPARGRPTAAPRRAAGAGRDRRTAAGPLGPRRRRRRGGRARAGGAGRPRPGRLGSIAASRRAASASAGPVQRGRPARRSPASAADERSRERVDDLVEEGAAGRARASSRPSRMAIPASGVAADEGVERRPSTVSASTRPSRSRTALGGQRSVGRGRGAGRASTRRRACRRPPAGRPAAIASGSASRPSASRIVAQLALDLGDGQAPEVEALDPRQDRRPDPRRVGRAEDEDDVVGRLLERLEEDVPALRDPLDLVDDVDLAAQVRRRGPGPLDAARGCRRPCCSRRRPSRRRRAPGPRGSRRTTGRRRTARRRWRFVQLRALATIRAIDVLPVPRGPTNSSAWAT